MQLASGEPADAHGGHRQVGQPASHLVEVAALRGPHGLVEDRVGNIVTRRAGPDVAVLVDEARGRAQPEHPARRVLQSQAQDDVEPVGPHRAVAGTDRVDVPLVDRAADGLRAVPGQLEAFTR